MMCCFIGWQDDTFIYCYEVLLQKTTRRHFYLLVMIYCFKRRHAYLAVWPQGIFKKIVCSIPRPHTPPRGGVPGGWRGPHPGVGISNLLSHAKFKLEQEQRMQIWNLHFWGLMYPFQLLWFFSQRLKEDTSTSDRIWKRLVCMQHGVWLCIVW